MSRVWNSNECSGGNGNGIEGLVYFYHPDHLGSSSYITDANGEVAQHLEYFAFGETFVEEHSNKDRTPYLYNAKELDEETGLYYYGARYYDPVTSVWQSVDPLWEQVGANRSPYEYTYSNPINFTDPTGMKPEDDIFVNTETGMLTVIKTEDKYDRIIIDGDYKGNIDKGHAQQIWSENNLPSNEASIEYGKNADRSKVSLYSTSVLVDVMNETNNKSVKINSTARTPKDQARIMAANVKSQGMAKQKRLYGLNGDKVLDQYPDQQAMIDKIYELGPSKVSKHLADPTKMNVVDISTWAGGIKNAKDFSEKASQHKGVSRVLSPWNSTDPAIHIEIPQPQK